MPRPAATEVEMAEEKQVVQCLVCAWRENCQKKYSVEAKPGWRCPEFERDLSLKDKPQNRPEGKQG